MYSGMLEEVVQINIYGATITDMKDKGFDIADILSKFGYGIYVMFDVPPKKCLDDSSFLSSSSDLSLSMTRVKEEVLDEDTSVLADAGLCSSYAPCPLLDASISTIAGSESDELFRDVYKMEDSGQEYMMYNLEEPLQEEEGRQEGDHASLMNTRIRSLSDTFISDSVTDCLLNVLDKVCAVEDHNNDHEERPVVSPSKSDVERISRRSPRKPRSPQRRLNQTLPAYKNLVPNAIRSSTVAERTPSVAVNNIKTPEEEYCKTDKFSDITLKVEDRIQSLERHFVGEVEEASANTPSLFTDFPDISFNANYNFSELGGFSVNNSHQFDLGYSEPSGSSIDKVDEAVPIADHNAGDKEEDEGKEENMNVEMDECDFGSDHFEEFENDDERLSDDEFFDCAQRDDSQNSTLEEDNDDDDEEMADCLDDADKQLDNGKRPAKTKRPQQPMQRFKCHFKGCKSGIAWRTHYGRYRFLQHVRTHCDLPSFKCCLCDHTCGTTDKMRHHHKVKHPKMPYKQAINVESPEITKELIKLWDICFPQISKYPEHIVNKKNPVGKENKVRRNTNLVKNIGRSEKRDKKKADALT